MQSLFSPTEYARLGQGLKVSRDIGLSGIRPFDKSGNRGLSINQRLDQTQPHRLAQELEAICYQL